MAVTELHPSDTLDDLRQRVAQVIDTLDTDASVRRIREALNEVGLRRKQTDLVESLDVLAAAQADLRRAREAHDTAKEEYDRAFAEAASPWALEGHFVTRSNKTWLAVDMDGKAIPEDEQRSYAEADRKEWAKQYAARQPAVVAAAAALRSAETILEEARDAVVLADKAVSARKVLVESAGDELRVLGIALTAKAGR